MKKLIAKRPVLYMGMMYQAGDRLPAQDQTVVDAWMKAGSAAWVDTAAATAAQDAGLKNEGWKVINALLDMGVILEGENGAFVGEESLEKQIMITPLADRMAADTIRAMGVVIEDENGDFVGEEKLIEQIRAAIATEGGQSGQEPEMVTGHLDAEDLAKMKKADLEDLAAKLGVDISKSKNNDERAALIAAVEIQAPAQENGGAQ